MIFGLFSRGDIIITPERYNYHPGDIIHGVVSLKLKKPTQANKFSISLRGEQTMRSQSGSFSMRGNEDRSIPQRQTKDVIYQFELPLDGEKEYTEAQYPFEIVIPADIIPQFRNPLANVNIGGVNIGGVLSSVAGLGLGMNMPIVRTDWSLNASLDISGTLDMRKSIQINIG